jgi:hypothetical protein
MPGKDTGGEAGDIWRGVERNMWGEKAERAQREERTGPTIDIVVQEMA